MLPIIDNQHYASLHIITETSLVIHTNENLHGTNENLHGTTARNEEATKHGKQSYGLNCPDQSP